MQKIALNSSMISEICFWEPFGELFVTFKAGGSSYVYQRITAALYVQLIQAPSAGTFFKSSIMDQKEHPFEKVTPPSGIDAFEFWVRQINAKRNKFCFDPVAEIGKFIKPRYII